MDNTVSNYFKAAYWKELGLSFYHALGTWKFWKELVMMTIGMMFGAAAVYYFLMPSHLIVGTISGLSIVINTLIGGNADTFSYLVVGINTILLLLAFLLIGNEFGAKTVYTALILGPLVQFWAKVYPYERFTCDIIDGQLVQVRDSVMSAGLGMGDVLFDLICFVILLSVCQAFLFRINASTGGLDILAKIINKYLHFDIGTSVSIGGAMICCTAFFINDFRMVVIGLIGTWVNGLVVDYFTASLNKRKRVCIISKEYEKIRQYIISELIRGCSLYKVTGGYSGEEMTEIQTLLTQDEFSSLMAFVRENDIKAFITAGNCSEVYGLWFQHKKHHGHIEIVNE